LAGDEACFGEKESTMIDLYTWTTPNGRKASIMLEETGLPYTVHPIDISKDEQFAPEFLKISPNNKIPAIVDQDTGASLMESGAILLYLAEKTGKFIPQDGPGRWRTWQWLMFQVGGAGPMLGQAHHFLQFNPGKAPYAEERFRTEARRLYTVMEKRLGEAEYLAGDDYTIADIATWPWISRFEWQGIDLAQFPNVRRWYLTIAGRPGVQRGYDVPKKGHGIPLA
jgi:GST-like protein